MVACMFLITCKYTIVNYTVDVYKGHPKLAKLEELVISHFQHMKSQQTDTRVIVFSSFRDSVLDISKVLAMHSPLVRVASFIGQASGRGKSSKGQKQSEVRFLFSFVGRWRDTCS